MIRAGLHLLITPTESENVRLYRYVKALGRVHGRWLYILERLDKTPRAIRIRSKSRDLWLRLNTTDILVYYSVFCRGDYGMHPARPARVIVDAGAYAGYSAVYFAENYPSARIIAIEPEPSNFALLEKNARRYPRITPVQKALWHESTRLMLQDQNTGHWGYAVSVDTNPASSNASVVDAITIDDIMRDFEIGTIDLLKVDIEGAEKELFEHSQAWIGAVNIIAAELHDRLKANCSQAFQAATEGFAFERKNDMTVFKSRIGAV